MLLNLSKDFDRNKFKAYSDKLLEKEAKVELKESRATRTISQNSYFHVCLGYFSLHTGYTIKEAKQEFAYMLPEMFLYQKNDRTFRKSTSDLSKEEMMDLIEYVRSFCLDQFGIYLPTSEEYLIDQFAIKRALENVK